MSFSIDVNAILSSFIDIAKTFGLLRASFVAFFFFFLWYTSRLCRQNIESKQGEIDRLAKENHKYRDIYLKRFEERGQQ